MKFRYLLHIAQYIYKIPSLSMGSVIDICGLLGTLTLLIGLCIGDFGIDKLDSTLHISLKYQIIITINTLEFSGEIIKLTAISHLI